MASSLEEITDSDEDTDINDLKNGEENYYDDKVEENFYGDEKKSTPLKTHEDKKENDVNMKDYSRNELEDEVDYS